MASKRKQKGADEVEIRRGKIRQQLADREDYRAALIERRNGVDVKISGVEAQIRELKRELA